MFQKSILLLIVSLITFSVSFANAQNAQVHELLVPPSTMLPFLQLEDLKKEIELGAEQQVKIQAFITEANDILKIPISRD
ncbi:MAG: hypothetical protein ABSA77_09415, partial [Thermoguttaceae bacterium]